MSAVLERTGLMTTRGEPLLVMREVTRSRRASSSARPVEIAGYFTRWDTLHEIEDPREAAMLGIRGRAFMESVRRGAFADAFAGHAAGTKPIKLLFSHGRDSGLAGMKPLGPITELREDATGPYFRARLFTDAEYVSELLPAIETGQLQPSYRFSIGRGTVRRDPDASEANPRALPEMTIVEASVREISLTPFPADPQASVSVVSAASLAA